MKFAALTLASFVLASLAPAEAFPLTPRATDDPFYEAPGTVKSLPNGAIVRSRQLDHATLGLSAPIAAAYQVLYKTQNPVTSTDIVTPFTVVIPPNALKSDQRNIWSYQTAYDATDPACGPSRKSASDPNSDPTGSDGNFIDDALKQNLTAVIPDYEGPNAAWLAGKLAGQSVLDAVRAVLDFQPAVPEKSKAQVVLEGYSGGALATGWAVQEQPTYAPELGSFIKGATLGGTPRNITRDVSKTDGGLLSGITLLGFIGLSAAYPELQSFFDQHLNQQGKDAFAFGRSHCAQETGLQYILSSFFPRFTDLSSAQGFSSPVVQKVLGEQLMAAPGSNVPTIPLFSYHGTIDALVPFQDTVDYYNAQCARGIGSLTRLDVFGLDHPNTAKTVESNQARKFLLDRLAGKPAPAGCSRSTFYPLTGFTSPPIRGRALDASN